MHINVTYLPKFYKQKYYLFVAIDRATRLIYYKVHENKSSQNAVEFSKEYKGLISGNQKFDVECKSDEIEHRLTAPKELKVSLKYF